MSADFNIAYNPVRTFEGDWCDVPGDKGGETYAGIAGRSSRTGRAGISSTRPRRTPLSSRAASPSRAT